MPALESLLAPGADGEARGLTAICSAHPLVLEAALRHGLERRRPVLVESTCNQVNQQGGYTGRTPAAFVEFVGGIARKVGLPPAHLLLGGDHLGPLPWAAEPAGSALEKAAALVRAYVQAGYTKIHLDCCMPCGGEPPLPVELIARRIAALAQVAEQAAQGRGLRYVIGSEVPPAGGAKSGELEPTVTTPAQAAETLEVTRQAFFALGLQPAWERVLALVVQPGVEFGDAAVHEYDPAAAAGLAEFIRTRPGLVYEAHSTDYQPRVRLRELVQDGFAILKVGPALTFALREGFFALAAMEETLCETPSHLRERLEAAMLADPTHWGKHYGGDARAQKFARAYSFSDRIRYYWNAPDVQAALAEMKNNLGHAPLPLALLSQYLPLEYARVRTGEIKNDPRELLLARVRAVLDDYDYACGV